MQPEITQTYNHKVLQPNRDRSRSRSRERENADDSLYITISDIPMEATTDDLKKFLSGVHI